MTGLDGAALLERLPDGVHRCVHGGVALLAKIRRDAAPGFFASEVRGLRALAAGGALRVPQVAAVAPHGIVLEDLGSGRPARAQWQAAGRGLAALHRRRADRFGYAADGYCGDTPQDNTWHANGADFFAECRLLPQCRRVCDRGLLGRGDAQRVEALCGRLTQRLPESPPVLIHGDLWSGNLHACAGGELALIDAGAVHYGWAECDLSMLILFGAPPSAFFGAYEEAACIDSGWRERAPLLNLYHLLNHLNLFGAGCLSAVRSAIERCG